ncbi:HpcH/HpaI aldolase/citrate lyase family protein [Kitasatospora sp. NBC_01287]|uniref:HpcH/HpaI aldolase/citrate lyase family protein n=1 Tax=Kitasatospora sp. NBC_01287 TaxID=2903573 RepID=UPI00225BB348|nr:HpcH/HpaI aldolase/citrate lyase family protein [Kitasatospora sp. NBC_01287]MCX4749320.1 HpcH/HpaI aldolase/citrate lyase family protein [Kitasatospora sp. NBC_01287]
MRQFGHLGADLRRRLFLVEPVPFDRHGPAAPLAAALGGTLYLPAVRPTLAADVRKQAARGVVSMVLCLEDAIADREVAAGEANLVAGLRELAAATGLGATGLGVSGLGVAGAGVVGAGVVGVGAAELPLLFVRVRAPEQIGELIGRLGDAARLLSGFVLPKFTEERGAAYLEALAVAEAACGQRLFGMPVLESPELAQLEHRREQLLGTARLLAKFRDRVLAVRLGVTDLCSAYGLRRAPELTAYDLALVAGVIGDVVNVLGRADGTGFTLTGPVWEYFPGGAGGAGGAGGGDGSGEGSGGAELAGLVREIDLDRANGLLGKTCVHPSQVPVVHARSVVSHEEYRDAQDVLGVEPGGRLDGGAASGGGGGGVSGSAYRNKMNEAKPHRAWAQRVLLRAEAFGVARPEIGFAELIAAGEQEGRG